MMNFRSEVAGNFASALRGFTDYRPPESSDIIKRIPIPANSPNPDFLRFFLPLFGAVVDLGQRARSATTQPSLYMQIYRRPLLATVCPEGEMDNKTGVMNAEWFLSRQDRIRRSVARTALFAQTDREFLELAGLGNALVHSLPSGFGPGAPQYDYVEQTQWASFELQLLPSRLAEMTKLS